MRSHKVIICAGSGGVGKTTVSAALAVAAAQSGLRTLVLTIDPARRLASALGLDQTTNLYTPVPGQNYQGQLFAGVIDAHQAFANFIRASVKDPGRADRIFSNPLYQQLSTTLSGSQEFTSIDCLCSAVESGQFDLVILDTPPSQHAIDFLRSPQKIYALFQSSITQWFMEPVQRRGLLKKFVSRGTQGVLSAFEKITGSDFVSQLAEFFRSLQGIQDKISQRSIEAHRLLISPQCAFVLVTGFDESKLQEAKDFQNQLIEGGYKLAAVIVNRAFPQWSQNGAESLIGAEADLNEVELRKLYENLKGYYGQKEKAYDIFQDELKGSTGILRIPDFSAEIVGLRALERMADEIRRRFTTTGGAK